MPLQLDARAMLTVGPNICKDKLMQAAGRMRKLGRNQSVFLVGTEEVTRKIREMNQLPDLVRLTPRHVMQWAMLNTIASVAPEGLAEWAKQGLHFCFTHNEPDLALRPEVLELSEMYGRPINSQSIDEFHSSTLTTWQEDRAGRNLPSSMQDLVKRITRRLENLGGEYHIEATGLDEECERELEKEIEKEEEYELQLPKRQPAEEKDWADYQVIFRVSHASKIPNAVKLSAAIGPWLDPKDNLADIDWDGTIFVTENVFNTVVVRQGESANLANFLRPIDALLVFEGAEGTQSFLLLSEREADSILLLLWKQSEPPPSPRFVNLSYARLHQLDPQRLQRRGLIGDQVHFPCSVLVSLQLFAGETDYKTRPQVECLKKMVTKKMTAKKGALGLPAMRGLQAHLHMSELEVVCDD